MTSSHLAVNRDELCLSSPDREQYNGADRFNPRKNSPRKVIVNEIACWKRLSACLTGPRIVSDWQTGSSSENRWLPLYSNRTPNRNRRFNTSVGIEEWADNQLIWLFTKFERAPQSLIKLAGIGNKQQEHRAFGKKLQTGIVHAFFENVNKR